MKTNESPASIDALVQERDYLIRSIEDLEREYAVGDVDDLDYRTLRASYVSRAATALRAIEAAQVEQNTHVDVQDDDVGAVQRLRRFLGRRAVRRSLMATCVICFALVMTIVAVGLAGVRLPGQNSSGSINLPSATQVQEDLTDAQVLASSGNLSEAVAEYAAVLKQVPNQPEALAYRGWLERLAGVAEKAPVAVRAGDDSIAQAIRVAPNYADARAFEVIVLLEDNHAIHPAERAFWHIHENQAERGVAISNRTSARPRLSQRALAGAEFAREIRQKRELK